MDKISKFKTDQPKKMNFRYLLIALYLFSPILDSHSQSLSKDYVFKYINESHGLSNNHVQSVIKDKMGFIWFGTGNGLNRFDGTKMRTYFPIEGDTNSISNHHPSKIFEGPEGNLWVRGINGNFDVYILDQGIFTKNINYFAQRYRLKSDLIDLVKEDQQNRFWFAHPNEGITVYDPKKSESKYLSQNSYQSGNITSNQISAMAVSPYGNIWVVFPNGILNEINVNSLKVVAKYDLSDALPGESFTEWDIFIDSDGEVWVFTPNESHGVFLINPLEESITSINEQTQLYPLNNNLVKAIAEKEKGVLWLGTDHGGINIIDKKNKTVSYVLQEDLNGGGLLDNTIYSLYKDNEGIMWVGTYKKGVNFYHEGMMRFTHVKKNINESNTLPHNDINVFVEDAAGNLFIGTNGEGLLYHDRQKGIYTQYLSDPSDPNTISGNVIVDLKIDADGFLWIGTYLHGLSRFDGEKFRRYSHDPKDSGSLSDVNVWKIYIDRQDRVWIGTLRGGVNLFDRDKDSFIRFAVGEGSFPINNQYISSFEEDDLGNLWIGGGYGIDVINIDSGYKQYYSGIDNGSGLIGNNTTEILKDSKGIIWVSTSQSLNYLDPKSGRFIGFTKKDGLPSDYVVSILEDENLNLWLSTQNGLSYVNVDREKEPYSLSFMNFDIQDGLQANFFNKNAALKTSDGEMIFGGPNGYNIFKTSNFAFALNDPKVVFTGFQLYNKPVKVGEEIDGTVVLERSISSAGKIKLKHNQDIFSLDFSALNFINFEKNKFRYRLEGFNDDWIVLDDPPFRVTYTNLDPGNYRLVVQAAQIDGQWSAKDHYIAIHIQAPFWKTPIAYLVYFLLLIALGWLARKQILLKEREQFKRLEEKREAQRLVELDQLKTRFFTNVSHEFRTPLTLILAPVEKLLQEEPEKQHTKQILTIQRNAKRLLQLVNQILDIKNIEQNGLAFEPSDGDIIRFIANKVNDFIDLSEKKHIKLNFNSHIKSLPTKFDADKVEKIIFNLLSNAMKFTPDDGQIDVDIDLETVEDENGILQVTVKDTGIGILPEELDKVFDRYFTSSNSKEINNQGSGIGLSLVKEFAKLHGGDIYVSSVYGVGSEFKVTLAIPVNPKLLQSDDLQAALDNENLSEMGGEFDSSKPTILLVEDNLEFRQYLKDFLEEEYKIILAQDGKDGFEKALNFIPDLIISDLMMPIMDGVALCQEIKKDLNTSHIPVILLTARSSEEKQIEGLQSGCNLFISKPFKFEILVTSIRNLLKERERLQNHFRKKISIHTSEQEIESLDDKLIQKAMQVVEGQIENPDFSVEQMSRELGMSRVHLYKKLLALTGKSPVEFIRLVRLQRAAQLLGSSQFTVSEVAYKVGFNNAKYFSKYFKAEFGILPSLYSQEQSVQ